MIYKNTAPGARIIRMEDNTEITLAAGESKLIEGEVKQVPEGVTSEDLDATDEKPIGKMSAEELDAKIAELEIDPETITGTGAEGKVIKADKVKAIEAKLAETTE